jgi:hypothetical protein
MANTKPELFGATAHAAIVNDTAFGQCRAIYVGVGGDITISCNGTDVLYKNAQSGSTIAIQATQVKSTNTTATNLVALF